MKSVALRRVAVGLDLAKPMRIRRSATGYKSKRSSKTRPCRSLIAPSTAVIIFLTMVSIRLFIIFHSFPQRNLDRSPHRSPLRVGILRLGVGGLSLFFDRSPHSLNAWKYLYLHGDGDVFRPQPQAA